MDAGLKIVTHLPLRELWRDDGLKISRRVRSLTEDDIRSLLRSGPIQFVVVDVGANVDCEPEMLQQFGLMGEIYSRLVLKIKRPRVGLLSIGEEEHKGNSLTRDATPLLKSLGINFIGNVEGRDLFSGHVDVIVCDGFVGNVALKVSEGLSEMIRGMLREALEPAHA